MKFRFEQDQEIVSWTKSIYEVEADSYEEAVELIEDNDYYLDEVGELVEEGLPSDRGVDERGQFHVVITSDEEGEEIFDGMI